MHPSFQTLLFPSQQLPLMAVIYMASRQHNIYKIILGKKDLNNSCQASKGAAVGSDSVFLFSPFLFCVRSANTLCYTAAQHSTQHTQSCAMHPPTPGADSAQQQQCCPSPAKGTNPAGNDGAASLCAQIPHPTTVTAPGERQHLAHEPYLHTATGSVTSQPAAHRPEHLLTPALPPSPRSELHVARGARTVLCPEPGTPVGRAGHGHSAGAVGQFDKQEGYVRHLGKAAPVFPERREHAVSRDSSGEVTASQGTSFSLNSIIY